MTGRRSDSPAVTPWTLPRWSLEAVTAANRFFAGRAVFRSGGREWRISARLARPPARWEMGLTLEVAGHQTALFLSSPVMALWEGCSLGARDFAALPGELRAAAVEARLDALIRDFTAWTGQPVEVQSCSLEPEASWYADESVPLRLERDDGLVVFAALHATPEGLAFLADAFGSVATPNAETVPREAMLVTALAELTGPALSLEECAGLAPGDVILTPLENSGQDGLPAGLRIGSMVLPARWKPGSLTLKAGGAVMDQSDWQERTPETAHQEDRDEPGSAVGEEARTASAATSEDRKATALRVDHIPLPVRFELGETALTVEELARLTPGQVFALEAPASAPVRITLSGRCLGRGSLVDVGGRIGVRVEELVETRDEGHAAV